MADILLRLETADDFAAVENLTREAFWDVYAPGCDEHLLAHKLRADASFVPELDLVAIVGVELAGNIMFARSQVKNDYATNEVLIIGPLSVLPKYQRTGIGTALLRRGLALAKEQGYRGVFLFGNPAYYGRLGFEDAKKYSVTTADGHNFPDFMGIELYQNALAGISGRLLVPDVYTIDPKEAAEFDLDFAPKEKRAPRTTDLNTK